jgi:hypothetical protein
MAKTLERVSRTATVQQALNANANEQRLVARRCRKRHSHFFAVGKEVFAPRAAEFLGI